MWIFTHNAFVSIVEHRDDPTRLIVRARFPGDLERLLPAHADSVTESPQADYRYRVTVDRTTATAVIAESVRGIDYPNFKDQAAESVAAIDGHAERLPALHRVWGVMNDAQGRAHGTLAPSLGLGLCFADNGDDIDLALSAEDDGLGCGFCGDQPDLCDCGNFLEGGE